MQFWFQLIRSDCDTFTFQNNNDDKKKDNKIFEWNGLCVDRSTSFFELNVFGFVLCLHTKFNVWCLPIHFNYAVICRDNNITIWVVSFVFFNVWFQQVESKQHINVITKVNIRFIQFDNSIFSQNKHTRKMP